MREMHAKTGTRLQLEGSAYMRGLLGALGDLPDLRDIIVEGSQYSIKTDPLTQKEYVRVEPGGSVTIRNESPEDFVVINIWRYSPFDGLAPEIPYFKLSPTCCRVDNEAIIGVGGVELPNGGQFRIVDVLHYSEMGAFLPYYECDCGVAAADGAGPVVGPFKMWNFPLLSLLRGKRP